MTDMIVAIASLTVIVVGVVAVQLVNWMSRRRWRTHEQFGFLVSECGFARIRDRFLVDTRIQRYAGKHRGRSLEIEVGAGAQGVYVRVDFEFEKNVDLGLRISSEHEDGFMTRLLRLREIEIGHRHFDSQFILLARDEQRLKELLDGDLRRMLVDLKGRVRDVRLNDDGLHLQLFNETEEETLRRILDDGAQLASTVFRRAEQLREQRLNDQAAAEAFTPVTGTMQAISVEDSR